MTGNITQFPSPSTILAEIETIEALVDRMRAVQETPCRLCTPDRLCWLHKPFHTQEHRHVSPRT